jgi:hypothetical protein
LRAAGEAPGPDRILPDHIFDIGYAFWKSKTLLSAVELSLFTALGDGPLDRDTLMRRVGIHHRGGRDFLDALVALELLDRDEGGRYANAPDCALYLDARKATYVGGQLERLNSRLYESWGHLTEALRTGRGGSNSRAAARRLNHETAINENEILKLETRPYYPRSGKTCSKSFPTSRPNRTGALLSLPIWFAS